MFFKLNPKTLRRWQPYLNEALSYNERELSKTGWVHGKYVSMAIGASFSKKVKYPSEPYGYREDTTPDEEKHIFTDADRFFVFATEFNKRFEENHKK